MKSVKRTVEMRSGMAYYRGRYLGITMTELDKAFHLPTNGEFKVVIRAGGSYKIVNGLYFYSISIDDIPRGRICKGSFQKLFGFKPDGRKRYSIQVTRL